MHSNDQQVKVEEEQPLRDQASEVADEPRPQETETNNEAPQKANVIKRKTRSKNAKKPKPKRPRKEVRSYPGRSLEDCIKIVEAIKTQNSGNPWPPDEVAKAIKIKARSSNLGEIIRSASLYGLVEGTYRAALVSLTELGRQIAYPPSEDGLRNSCLEAIRKVDLFDRVLTHYNDGNLPGSPFINNTLTREFNIPTDFHDEFLRVLKKNIEYIGSAAGWSQSQEVPGTAHIVSSKKGNAGTGLRAFVIMPFTERKDTSRSAGFFKEVYVSIILPACKKAGFIAVTAERKGSDIIHTTIVREILEADLVIADLTDHNPNVMFELGLRMAQVKKPISILKSKDTGKIFDVDNVLRVYEYNENLWPSTVQRDIPELADHISATWEARNTGSSYVEILTGKSGQ